MLRVPCESLRKTFKTTQRHLERNIEWIKATSNELTTSSDQSPESAVNKIDQMIGRVSGLKRKLSSLKHEHEETVRKSKARLDYLQTLKNSSNEDNKWMHIKLNMLLADYCLRTGKVKSAKQLAEDQNINELVDMPELTELCEIEQSLRKDHSITKCLAWCADNRQYLKKTRSNLEFEVKFQHYIELVRSQEHSKAIEYYRLNLVKAAETKFPLMLRASGLLAFSARPQQESGGTPTPGISDGESDVEQPYADLYSPSRWTNLADMFVETYETLHGLPHRALFLQYLATGMTALKTHSCHLDTDTPSNTIDLSRGYMCPVCSVELRKLARNVPYVLHVHSRLEPDPVMLPNGRIYGEEKLWEYSRKTGTQEDKVVDPVTREIFQKSIVTKVFPT